MAMTLTECNHNVLIVSSNTELKKKDGNISINCFKGESLSKSDKITVFKMHLETFDPDITICSESLPVIAARQYRKQAGKKTKILYDITEWYPSPRFLKEFPPMMRWFGFMKLMALNIYACFSVNVFIFGEWYKSKPYRFMFPFTPHIFIPYYPDLKYIDHKDPSFSGKKLRLSYSGEISIEKGFGNFMKVVYALSDLYPDLDIEVRMVSLVCL